MKTEVKLDLCVDAGSISAADLGYYKASGGGENETSDRLCKVIDLPPGKYQISLEIPDCWSGRTFVSGVLDISSGKLAIGDACYFWDNDDPKDTWGKFLDKTDFLQSHEEGQAITADTGGDGQFEVIVKIEKID